MRFATWMWRNQEVHGFVEWLRGWNNMRDHHEAVGFYGLDLYSLRASMRAVIDYLDEIDKEMANVARDRYGRLMDWAEDPHEYGLEALSTPGFKGYEKDVIKMLKDLLSKRLQYSSVHWDGDEFHSSEQNARVVRGECNSPQKRAFRRSYHSFELKANNVPSDAEHYYKAIYYGRDESWNLRDSHMFETLVRVLKYRGSGAKAILWAHNSHIGDARATSMSWSNEEFNIGQLCKETFGQQALNIGCGGHTGTVAAANRWDGDMRAMQVRPGLPNSYEALMHATGIKNFVLDLRERKCDGNLREALMNKRLERFIGVIYRPNTERKSHYSSAVLPEQFDGFVWFDETRQVGALEVHQPPGAMEFDETWPFGI